MKNSGSKNAFFKTLTVVMVFWFSGNHSQAQEVNLTGGIGQPEMLNVGVRLQYDQVQIGVNAGTNLAYKNSNFDVSGEFYYHFGGRSSYTSLQPWYAKAGLTYLSSEGDWEKRTNLVLVPRLGREFNITSEFGIALEAGIMVMLIDNNQAKKERTGSVSGDLDLIGSEVLMTSAGVKIFYRLL